MNDTSTILFEWTTTRVKETKKSGMFYGILMGIMVILLAISIWQNNLLFGVFIILAVGTMLFIAGQPSQQYRFAITPKGIHIGDEEIEHPFDRLSHFDIYEYADGDKELFIMPKERFRTLIHMRIHPQDQETIISILTQKIPQKTIEPSLLDILSKVVGI